jgi:hypothetical protein
LAIASDPEIEALIAAFYAAFDNRDGRAPGLDGLRALFIDTATITRVSGDAVERWDPDAFIAPRRALLTDGTLTDFHEWEVEGRTTVLADIASRWSTYRKQGTLHGAPYDGGGDKFIQLYRRDGRWRINAVLWQDD